MNVDFNQIPTPCYVLDEHLLRANLEKFARVKREAGVNVICALKGFSFYYSFKMLKDYLDGAAASSLHEARLCKEELGVGAHVYSPAYLEKDFDELLKYASGISFNSLSQWEQFKSRIPNEIKCGLRINPEYSEIKTDIYNPAIPASRLGVIAEKLGDELPDGITGLHFHVLCENNSYTLERTLVEVERRFGKHLKQCEWINMGGGHLITHPDYDIDHLIQVLNNFKQKFPHLKIVLEPGQSVGLNTGYLVTSILDIVDNRGTKTIVFDASFTCHMPDVLEAPYRPDILGAGKPGEYAYTYRLGGLTCLAGDVIGDYSFPKALEKGSKLVFLDMAHYTMVKNNTFNGVRLPSIAIRDRAGSIRMVRTFHYEDYRNRLS